MIVETFLAYALHSTMPAENYNSWFSPEISHVIAECVVNGDNYSYLDYNGDGVLNAVDAFSVYKHYTENVVSGNELTVDEETISSIITENYDMDDVVEWELMADSNVFTEITTVDILITFNEKSEVLAIIVNPFEERVMVTENGN